MPESTRSYRADPHLRIVILAGGIGSRFWPASTPERPKQLLPLASERPLIVDTVERARRVVDDERISILTGEHLAGVFRGVLPQLGDDAYLIEPRAKGTAPVLAWAAHELLKRDPEAIMVSLHADHRIAPIEAFVELVRAAGEVAQTEGLLLTVGAVPDRPETGYGYIGRGEAVAAPEGFDARRVETFTEKPDRETAEAYLDSGFLWNTGIFVWRADLFLEEVRGHAPEVGELLPLLDEGKVAEFFERAPTIAVDVAVLERSGCVGTIAATFEWDDVGSWESLSRTAPADAEGNVAVGRHIRTFESRENLVYSESQAPVVLDGVEGLVVVRTEKATLVTTRERAPHLKRMLAHLEPEIRDGAVPSDGGDE